MYASFFGLRELPFNNTPDPRYFYSTPDHEEALASLIYAISESRGFVLLTGEVGAGKTLITRLMLRHFNDRIVYASINNTRISPTDLLRCICDEYRIDYTATDTGADLLRRLQDFLVARFTDGKPVVLMLDEAQALSRDAFEQIRMIGNVETDDAKLLQIVIVGQPELRERFEADDMRQLRQRIFRSFHLRGLTREQTEGYIRHRLSVGGAQYPERIFDEAAIDLIFQYSQGLPRLINTVCDNAMLSAYAADQLAIDGPFLQRVIQQMTSVAQGGPHFASPRVPADMGIPQNRPAECAPPPAPALAPAPAPALQVASPDARRLVEEAAQAIAAQAERVRQNVLTDITAAAERMRSDVAGAVSDARVLQARVALENSIERSCVVETRLKSELIETTDALHDLVSKAQGLHERLRAVAVETEGRIDHAAQRAHQVQSSVAVVTEQLDTVSRRCAPLVGQLRRQTEQARTAMAEVAATTAEARAAAAAAQATQISVEESAQRLATQAARSSRLTVTLRQAFARLEKQAAALEQRAQRIGGEEKVFATNAPARLRERSRALSEVLDENRSAIAEVRSTLSAATTGVQAARMQRTRLAEHVSALTALINEARSLPA